MRQNVVIREQVGHRLFRSREMQRTASSQAASVPCKTKGFDTQGENCATPSQDCCQQGRSVPTRALATLTCKRGKILEVCHAGVVGDTDFAIAVKESTIDVGQSPSCGERLSSRVRRLEETDQI